MAENSEQPPIAERIEAVAPAITPAEKKVARVLTASAMLAGFETVAALAGRAEVSGPTVVRFIARLGYESYTDFQKALLREMEGRRSSPLSLYHRAEAQPGTLLRKSAEAFSASINETFRRLSVADFEFAVAALTERRNRIFITGGRFTRLLAEMLQLHLFQLRPQVSTLLAGLQSRADQLLAVGPRSVLVAFDFRRYEAETVSIVRSAKERGATVVVITDPWNSPAARYADAVLAADVASPSPFDSMVPATALTEALIAEITVREGKRGRTRIQDLEILREGYEWTEDARLQGKRRAKR
jgi:DNA-binding MurR/RpiR family transcriptional regulator